MRILIAEDATNIRMALKRLLEKWGHDVIAAKDGQEAWEILQKEDIRFVISDWMMPNMDGVELCQRIRDADTPHYTYIVLLTGRSEKADLVEGMAAGADDFVAKPFNKGELQVRIRAAERMLNLQDELAQQNDKLGAAYGQIRKDLEAAAEVQKDLLPKEPAAVSTVDFEWLFRPSTYVAGDILDFFKLDDEHIAFYHLDVAGHGIPSALLSVMLSKVMRAEYYRTNGNQHGTSEDTSSMMYMPKGLVENLNERFQATGDSSLYFTMVYGVLNTTSGKLRLCQAGHPSPLLIPARGEPTLLGSGGFPVGMLPDLEYDVVEVDLKSGDRIVLYSDGITECMDDANEQFGETRLTDIFVQHRDTPMNEILESLGSTLTEWKGNDQFEDDVSVLALQMH